MPKQIEIGSLLIPHDPHNSMGAHTAVVLSHRPNWQNDLYEVLVTFEDPASELTWGRVHKWRTSAIMKMYEVLECPG